MEGFGLSVTWILIASDNNGRFTWLSALPPVLTKGITSLYTPHSNPEPLAQCGCPLPANCLGGWCREVAPWGV